MPDLTPEDFLASGYRKFPNSGFNHSVYGLQKTVKDSEGNKAYFLTIWVYDFQKYQALRGHRWGFESDVILYPRELSNGLVIKTSVTDIEVFEKYLDKLYKFCGSIPDRAAV